MKSFLKHLEDNYETFNMFDGALASFNFPKDIIEILTIIMKKANKFYVANSKVINAEPYDIKQFYLEKDANGKCYLKVIGADNHTVIIIRQDNSDIRLYNMLGKKITESEFFHLLDYYQKEKLARSGVSKRFIKDEIPEIDTNAEINTESLIAYYEYLKDYYLDSISDTQKFVEPDSNEKTCFQRGVGEGIERQRKNEVIDYDLRKKELLKYKPFKIYNFVGAKSNEEIDVYVYEREGFIIAVAEPTSGLSYTKILNLGYIDAKDEQLITANIKAALEATEEIVLLDDAIIRKSHTTLEVFKKNLEVIFENDIEYRNFSADLEASKNVYKR